MKNPLPNRPGSADRGAVVALLMAVPIALMVVLAWAPLKGLFPTGAPDPDTVPVPRPKGKTPTPAPKGAAKLGWGLPVAPDPRPAEPDDVRRAKALAGCKRLAKAIEDYTKSELNPGAEEADRYPQKPQDLYEPPFGGPSFLPNKEADLVDPWGRLYGVELTRRKDGTAFFVAFSRAPDGTPISQFGIGSESAPPKE